MLPVSSLSSGALHVCFMPVWPDDCHPLGFLPFFVVGLLGRHHVFDPLTVLRMSRVTASARFVPSVLKWHPMCVCHDAFLWGTNL